MSAASSALGSRFELHPHRTLLALVVPALGSLAAEPVTGLVDTAFVARLGSEALAALGVATILVSSLFWIFNFLAIGTQTEVARALGAGDRPRAGAAYALALTLSVALGTALAVLLWPLLPILVGLLGAQGEVARLALDYLHIRLWGAPALLATLAAFGALRGAHDMRTPLAVAVGTNALNIALDPLLIFGLGPIPALGVEGAALASVAGHWAGAAWAVGAAQRALGASLTPTFRGGGRLLVVGRDLVLRTGCLVLFLALATRAATRLGADSGGAHQAVRQVWLLTALLLDAFALAAQSLVGAYLGRDDVAAARRVAGVAVAWGVASGLGLALAMVTTTDLVAALLVPQPAQRLFAGAWWAPALAQPLNAATFVTDGVHWATRDYAYLRNAVLLATLGGGLALAWLELTGSLTLAAIWWITGGWIVVRAGLGVARIWPGLGRAPLAAD